LKRAIILATIAGLTLPSARAAEPPNHDDVARPCRPTVSCTAELAAPGTLEVEAGAQSSRASDGSRTVTFPFLFKQTLTPWLEAQLGSNGYTANVGRVSARYLDNLAIGTKLNVLHQGKVAPAISMTALASFPTFERPGYARFVDASFTGHASKDVGPVHVDANVGVQVFRLEHAVPQAFGALAGSVGLPAPFGASLELYGFSEAGSIASRDAGVRGVLSMSPRPWWVLDIGADAGLFPSTRVYTLFFGMTVIPVVFWR
jgi:hypothetical protein